MKKILLDKKMSGTGTIHDIKSEYYRREIKFRKGTKYAVILASFYGDIYTTHCTEEAAIKASRKNKDFSHLIMDINENWYWCNGYELISTRDDK